MSRSGYCDSCEGWELVMWRGAVVRAINGKRGQAFLREMLDALDALPEPRLIGGDLVQGDGSVCAIGSVGVRRGTEMGDLDPEDSELIAARFGIANAMVKEIEYVNDEMNMSPETPEKRFERVRRWAVAKLLEAT